LYLQILSIFEHLGFTR